VKHWSERLSCQCGKTFRSISAEAVHRHNFPILCRRAKHGNITFDIVKSTDAGFGISVYDHDVHKYLTHHFGIEWRRTLGNCQARAVEIMKLVRAGEKNGK